MTGHPPGEPKSGAPMRIVVDESRCSGHGRCYALAPEIYHPDDDGYCAERGSAFDVPEGLEDEARAGLAACPQGAISVQ